MSALGKPNAPVPSSGLRLSEIGRNNLDDRIRSRLATKDVLDDIVTVGKDVKVEDNATYRSSHGKLPNMQPKYDAAGVTHMYDGFVVHQVRFASLATGL